MGIFVALALAGMLLTSIMNLVRVTPVVSQTSSKIGALRVFVGVGVAVARREVEGRLKLGGARSGKRVRCENFNTIS